MVGVGGEAGVGITMTPEVRLEQITRRFGDSVANDRVDLRLQPGTVHALVGENGAGKSTLMRILYGLLRPDEGRILLDGRPTPISSPAAALAHGIGMIHQHFMLVPVMTVLENIVLGTPGARGLRSIPRRELSGRLRDLFMRYGFDLSPEDRIDRLGVGGRQRVEIARLLYRGARVLICDEPTAVLAPPEVSAFLDVLRRFRDEGRSVVLVTHKLSEVLRVADEVTVLRHGRVAGAAPRSEIDHDRLVRWIVGDSPGAARDRHPGQLPTSERAPEQGCAPTVAISSQDLSLVDRDGRRRFEQVTFDVAAGEIFGIAGVAGNGQSELAQVLAGRQAATGGDLMIDGHPVARGELIPESRRPALIPEDRHQEGLIGTFRLWENLLLGRCRETPFMRAAWYGHRDAQEWAHPLLERYRVKPAGAHLRVSALSGGNQQKLLCGREMSRDRRILVACQPTRGIDLESTAFLHALLREYAGRGAAVVLISTDLEEVLALSDRVAVMYRGRLGEPCPRDRWSREQIGREMVGMAAAEAGADCTAGSAPAAENMPSDDPRASAEQPYA